MHCNRQLILLASLFVLTSSYSHASVKPVEPLCPPATDRLGRTVHYGNLNKTISAPKTQDEIQEQFQLLADQDKDQRYAAIMALALAGNLELFDQLVQQRDRDGLFIYASNYVNADGSRCLDARLEQELLDHHREPWLQRTLQVFFPKNRYQRQALFEEFLSVPYDPNQPAEYQRYARALTATNLTGVEPAILRKARGLLMHETPKQKNNLPVIHQEFIQYFSRRGYAPAVAYVGEVLKVEPRDEPVEHFRYQYIATRNLAYRALRQLPSAHTNAIYLEELGTLSQQPWDALFSSELHALLENAVTVNSDEAYQSALVQQLVQVMQTPSLPGQPGYLDRRKDKRGAPAYHDYQVRKEIYARLGQLGSTAAANALLDEWQRVRESDSEQNRAVLVISLIGVFLEFPEPGNVDAARLIQQARQLPTDIRVSYLLAFMQRYDHPGNVELFFSMLDGLFIPEREPVAIGNEQTEKVLIERLMQRDDRAIDAELRHRLDDYYALGHLAQTKYLRYAQPLNERLGDESPVYLALMAERQRQQQLRKREAEEQYRQELKQQAQALFERNASPEGIRNNIQALSEFGSEARQAGYWLVRVGADVLPYAHEALGDPASNAKLKMQLTTVLGEIGDVRSTSPIITSARAAPRNSYVYQNAFLALGQIPQTPEARVFADSVLSADYPAFAQRSALAYYAQHRDDSAAHWAREFSALEVSEELRYAGLYLAARLGLPGTVAPIKHELLSDPDRSRRRVLLRSLAEVAEVATYDEIASQTGVLQQLRQDYERLRLVCQFRYGTTEDKARLAEPLLRNSDPVYGREVIRFLVSQRRADILSDYLGLNRFSGLPPEMVIRMSPMSAMIISEARRQGYRVEATDNGLVLHKQQ
ncbi:MAG: hypothetical protein AMS22_12270 [Thiotrichales bacterium SG8_50]|nr:MAG: hypothetical protein AMS22_12270 [Thiotrichales bacterium SG8_50]